MNIVALIGAIVAVIVLSLTVHLSKKSEKKMTRFMYAVGGLVLAFSLMGLIGMLFGDESMDTAMDMGSYLGIIIIGLAVLKAIFFKEKKTETQVRKEKAVSSFVWKSVIVVSAFILIAAFIANLTYG